METIVTLEGVVFTDATHGKLLIANDISFVVLDLEEVLRGVLKRGAKVEIRVAVEKSGN